MRLDPAEIAELRRAAYGPQAAGIALALAGVSLALIRWRWLPSIPRVVPVATIVLALGLIGIGIIRRIRWQMRHIRRER